MKKAKFVALSLVASVGLMGAGYAALTETTKQNVSASTSNMAINLQGANASTHVLYAEGNSIAPKDQKEVSSNKSDAENESEFHNIGATHGVTRSEALDAATYTFSGLFPNTVSKAFLNLKNDGEVAGVFSGVTVDTTGTDGALLSAVKVKVIGAIEGNGTKRYEFEKGDIALGDLQTELNTLLKGQYLAPGETLNLSNDGDEHARYHLEFTIPESAGSEIENKDMQVEIDYDFEQYNTYGGTIYDGEDEVTESN
ncbi:hypothetical protein FZC84_17970 [Rossellomorea vietnamensis]|uniref:Uncharacterized protein n=1 Tax=Rossellomorea vietnamensis TaxID=218284 RepID=A0A5D4M769_9BACI|nr:hypothetical protein [Rossellomorea vietnamensis]TYR97734.1 hypothetical protein FZC84_17970 [Rossellomorea vietnamensis]